MITFDTKITSDDMYRFNMHHAYTSSQGIISILVGAIAIAASVMTFGRVTTFYTVAYFVLGIAFLVYIPCTLKLKSKAQMVSSAALSSTFHYCLEEDGLKVTLDMDVTPGEDGQVPENTAKLPWNNVYKVVTTKKQLLIYSSRVNAYIIPRSAVEGQIPEIRDFFAAHLMSHQMSFKW